MIRIFDFLFSLFGILTLSPLLILLWIFGLFENGSPIFKQIRVGYYQRPFILFKFRTMPLGVSSVATHLVKNLKLSLFGSFLRKTKLDEILQLWNVLIGEMSLVGPRPCLLNQKKLINERKKRGVFKKRPGITGLAQIKGITMKNPTLLAKTDLEMIKQLNVFNYFYYILVTMILIFKK
jgi:lipopolysaccharide/colanic/teichoic acid biosynthesis glycosyltransferase